jgi:hypothetical protein
LNFNKLFRPVEALFGGFWTIFVVVNNMLQ